MRLDISLKLASSEPCHAVSPPPLTWKIENLCDLNIECKDGSNIEVHKHILEMNVSALRRALQQENQKHVTSVKFINTDPKAVKEFVRFIYTHSLNDIDGVEKDVLDLARKLEIEDLAEACLDKIQQNITISSVVTSMILAEENNFDALKSLCLKFILNNFKEVRDHQTWKNLSKFPDLLLELLLMERSNQLKLRAAERKKMMLKSTLMRLDKSKS